MLDSVIRVNKKYYPQTLLDECKYVIRKNKMENLINNDLTLNSSDEGDNESDNKSDNESNTLKEETFASKKKTRNFWNKLSRMTHFKVFCENKLSRMIAFQIFRGNKILLQESQLY